MINFTELYDEYIDGLFNFGGKFTNDRELLKDCIQDVFVKMYTKAEELDGIDNIKSYLYASLRYRINDEYRHNAFMSETPVEEKPCCMKASNDVECDYVEDETDRLNNHKISYFMQQLSPRQRQALTLYYIEERKYDDICNIMGINYQSVRNLMHRSLDKLRSVAVEI